MIDGKSSRPAKSVGEQTGQNKYMSDSNWDKKPGLYHMRWRFSPQSGSQCSKSILITFFFLNSVQVPSPRDDVAPSICEEFFFFFGMNRALEEA